jgi:hypothetical protein
MIMKKVIGLVALGLLLCASFATAVEVNDWTDVAGKGVPPRPADRTGSCTVTSVDDTANTVSVWGATTWFLGDAHAIYIDPATDQDAAGGCSAPFYPFRVTSVDFLFVELTDDTNQVGRTVTYEIQFVCPQDLAVGSVSGDECHGPGAVFATYTLSYTLLRSDFDENGIGGFISLNLPVDVCVDRGFFIVARFTAWDGVGMAPQIVWHRQRAEGGPVDRCDNWLWLGTALAADCWLLTGYEIGYGCGADPPPPGFASCFPGSAFIFANGDAGDFTCTPISLCPARPNLYPGDDAGDPINVNTSPWVADINLCDYTSDYNYYYDAGAAPTTSRRWTGRNEDVVLDLNYSQNPIEACFAVVITPVCPPRAFFQLRSWIVDSFGPLYWGTPQYPGSGVSQVYDFTPTGLQCQFPDRYLLYIDARGGCCCPINVAVSGDLPLPVELVGLTATAGDGYVRLNWTTRQESNIMEYVVNRGEQEAGIVDGLGDSPTGHHYTFVDRSVVNGQTYTYNLSARTFDGSIVVFPMTVNATPTATPVVTEYSLSQNFPNPFNPSTSITYTVKEAGTVSLKVFSVDGREVATLVDETQDANIYSVSFDGAGLASGVYLYTLEVNGFTATHKMVLMK